MPFPEFKVQTVQLEPPRPSESKPNLLIPPVDQKPTTIPKKVDLRSQFPIFCKAKGVPFELLPQQDREVREAFNLFDMDGSGAISAKEWRVAMRALGFALTSDDVKKMMKSILYMPNLSFYLLKSNGHE